MPNTGYMSFRIDNELLANSKALFSTLGITATQAITMFFTQCVLNNGLPFEVKIPNAKTMQALDDAHAGIGIETFSSEEEMFESWNSV